MKYPCRSSRPGLRRMVPMHRVMNAGLAGILATGFMASLAWQQPEAAAQQTQAQQIQAPQVQTRQAQTAASARQAQAAARARQVEAAASARQARGRANRTIVLCKPYQHITTSGPVGARF